ncbi:MAG: hypothetical protein D3906_11985, partial [Candidatus Electrothrix sp. AUS1_2]|nr:hypothetical protein [Candidatus Electrothrix sp. AUS1_2]
MILADTSVLIDLFKGNARQFPETPPQGGAAGGVREQTSFRRSGRAHLSPSENTSSRVEAVS